MKQEWVAHIDTTEYVSERIMWIAGTFDGVSVVIPKPLPLPDLDAFTARFPDEDAALKFLIHDRKILTDINGNICGAPILVQSTNFPYNNVKAKCPYNNVNGRRGREKRGGRCCET
jgi:hypothetical protein